MNTLPPESLPLGAAGHARVAWRRSAQARRITLRIDPKNAQVVVTLPLRAGRAAGVALLHAHAAWVLDRLAAIPASAPFADGGQVMLNGAPLPIQHAPQARGGAWLQDGVLHVSGDAAFLPRRVTDFLRAEARLRLSAQAIAKAQQTGTAPSRVVVKDTRSRWGSCAPDRTLMFCWRLIMAPPAVQDYVVAHEVAHLTHLNHGAGFWKLCDTLSPHRESAVAWLKDNGPRLMRAG